MSFRTVDFLPEIFQTPVNRQFLSATLDQLTQEPKFKKTQGFIGRRVGPGVNPNDRYVVELDKTRADYQLEPGVVSLDNDRNLIQDVITYPGMLDALKLQGANTQQQSRLWNSEYYCWDPFINFDKFINFSQYYWLPDGPQAVDISSTSIPLTDSFQVTRTGQGYEFSGLAGNRPTIYLLRGGNYTFEVDQFPNNFWIQVEPGVNGRLSATPNISSRDVFGVENNGASNGTITFNVPAADAQQFYYDLPSAGNVDLVTTTLSISDINNVYLSQFLANNLNGIDGITNLNQKTIIFTSDTGWTLNTRFDPLPQSPAFNGQVGSFDTTLYDQETVIPFENRYNVWRIVYEFDSDGEIILTVVPARTLNVFDKISILFGTQWSNTQWYKNTDGFLEKIPLLTAIINTLYYQDSTNPEFFGVIKLLTSTDNDTIFIDNILGKTNYTSPTGVKFTNNLKVVFRGSVVPSIYQNKEFYVSGVGTAIQLLPVTDYITPETYVDSDEPNQPLVPDYILMSLDSPSLSAWSRTNRWFHIDVINAAAEYNNTVAVFDNRFRAKRPILEFRGGLQLFNMGTAALAPVDIVDFVTTDALSTVNGSTEYQVDGYTFVNGTRVVFAADDNSNVKNKIYQVSFIEPAGDSTSEVILLSEVEEVLPDNTVLSLFGNTTQGKTYWYNGLSWIAAQQKNAVNQAPLFDVFDLDGISYSDQEKYISSNFIGSKIFSYKTGSGRNDEILGFPLSYLTLSNVGDIVFDNNFYNEKFTFLKDNAGAELFISNGIIKEYQSREIYVPQIGWQTAVTRSQVYQQFRFAYKATENLILDVAVFDQNQSVIPVLKVYVGEKFQIPGTYTYTVSDKNTIITLTNPDIVDGDIIEVQALSDQISSVGFYQIPENLENNPFNGNSSEFTLGTARQHYQSIAENLTDFSGNINGANNVRDLGNIIPYGLVINQQSSPLTLAGYFLRNKQFDIFSAIEFNSREYEKTKAQILNLAAINDYTNRSVPDILNDIITQLGLEKTSSNSFYWSDMLPFSNIYTETVYTYTPISIKIFDTTQIYDFTQANYLGLLVYLNNQQLTRGLDYIVSTDSPTITIITDLAFGDQISIREYTNTAGSFIPNTPTKLGLYPATRPEIFLDESYIEPTTVIRGHDGSITIAFNDFRDDLLLEFEKRIFNNLKLDGNPIPLNAVDVIPGQFRKTDYSFDDVKQILAPDFFSWVGWNKLDFKTQNYLQSNKFTYNYAQAQNKLNKNALGIGNWRGVYNYFYDTVYPNTRPWEMLGFSVEPNWWQEEYGPPPYTSGNLVLWDDLAQGLVRDPLGSYILPQYQRLELTQVIPTGSEGQLVSPFDSVVGNYSQSGFRLNWKFGDDGPVENAWRTSSSYPFSIMRLLALTRPAEFFTLFADRDLYRYDRTFQQYLLNQRYRLDANGVEIYGNGVSKASYINWIVDFTQQSGIDATDKLTKDLAALTVRLCYRFASFTAKNLLQVYTEKSSPQSINSGLLLPDESYNLFLYKNVPTGQATYSSVIIQKTNTGYSVYGYGIAQPYFEIRASVNSRNPVRISSGDKTVEVNINHSDDIIQIPYGFEYSNISGVADFLISYGAHLTATGFIFDQYENGYVLNWQQMVSEFLYWDSQGWGINSVINLNPLATQLKFEKPYAIVDNVSVQTQDNLILDQEKSPLKAKNLIVDRQDNRFVLSTTNNQTINYITVNLVNYEHIMVLDNRSIFADLIYDPVTGARQERVKIVAITSGDWLGQLNAPGFILNQDNILEWQPLKKYAKGEIVKYKNFYYSATTIIQPSDKFEYNQWKRSDYNEIQTGLLPNLANKSNQLANSYNVYTANLERDQDLFGYGLIGFRPRQYMTALNLDDVSQVNLYRQFLGTKGTVTSSELFKFADLGKGSAEFDIYENWAIQKAIYGANANRNYVELQLNEALLNFNPSTVKITNPQETSNANQNIQFNNIWKSSYRVTGPNIWTTTQNIPPDSGFPTAGFVNVNDVDFSVFSLNDPTALNPYFDELDVGKTIWVAKVNDYSWDVYRIYSVDGEIIQLRDNLNGTAQVIFNKIHNLAVDQSIIIKYFDNTVDGVYRVLAIPSPTSVIIPYIFVNINQTLMSGNGIAYSLKSLRVDQASDIAAQPMVNDFNFGTKFWISNHDEPWQVIEKQQVFVNGQTLTQQTPVIDSGFGVSVAQSQQNLFALIGSPGYSASGAIYTYVKNNFGDYVENNILECNVNGTRGFGQSITVGNLNFSAVGAPNSDIDSVTDTGIVAIVYRIDGSSNFSISQILLPENDLSASAEFGHSLAMSRDERWLYIGAPGINAVYAFAQIPVQTQLIRYRTDGNENTFNYSNFIVIDENQLNQIVVILNNQLLTTGEYTLNGGNLILNNVPSANLILSMTRRTIYEFNGTGTDTYNIGNYLYTANDIYSFVVKVNGILQAPFVDYTFVNSSQEIVFSSSLTSSDKVLVTTNSYYQFVDKLEPPITVAGARFGHSLDCTIDGSQILVGAKNDTVNSTTDAGAVYVFERNIQKFVVTDANQNQFTTATNLVVPTQVSVNGQTLTINTDNIGGNFSVIGNDTVELDVELSTGDTVEIAVNTFNFLEKISAQAPHSYAEYGYSVKICQNSCSLYVGSPGNNGESPQTGLVDRIVNQSRIYNTISATVANPVLNSGDSIRINNVNVTVPGTWSLSNPYEIGDIVYVLSSGIYNLYRARQSVPVAINISNSDYWELIATTTFGDIINLIALSYQIGSAVPNVTAVVSAPVVIQANGIDRTYSMGDAYQNVESYTPLVYVNSQLQQLNVDYTLNLSQHTITFTLPPQSTANIQLVTGVLTISLINELITSSERLIIGLGLINPNNVYNALGLKSFVFAQSIVSPRPKIGSRFGQSLAVDSTSTILAVGAPRDSAYTSQLFDNGVTYFDGNATAFFSSPVESGAVYTFDLLSTNSANVDNPDLFVFGQQLYPLGLASQDKLGTSLDYTNSIMLMSSPGYSPGSADLNYGRINSFVNEKNSPAWAVIRQETPVVDIKLINNVFCYDAIDSSQTTFFDFIDPLQGKILGAARQNIDYIGAVDPASYNVGNVNNFGQRWSDTQVGKIWWDTSNTRFINPNQDDINYASAKWSRIFPGSQIEVYQWTQSPVPPAQYAGPGIPKSLASYTTLSRVDTNGVVQTNYYFWVRGNSFIEYNRGKNLSTVAIERYIEDPTSTGIPFVAFLDSTSLAIFNFKELVNAQDTILSIEFDRELNDNAVHVEYELIPEDRADGFLSENLYRKLQDSFCGADVLGNIVPDPSLRPANRYGIEFRPRQSMFVDRFAALENYLTRVNTVLARYPISESRSFSLLNSSEPTPGSNSGQWDVRVANLTELSYQDFDAVPVGYRYLVESNSEQSGFWTINEVTEDKTFETLQLVKVQSFDTARYWNYQDWYQIGYNSSITPVAEIDYASELVTLSVPLGSSVKVRFNSNQKFEIYQRTQDGWLRVGLEDGTIAFSRALWDYQFGRFGYDVEVFDNQYFDQEPVIETRKIIQAINQELLIDDLLIERNRALILIFNFILSESLAPQWLTKTSLIDVDHRIRQLLPYQIYNRDNQEFVIDYIQEVKPYHVQVRELNLIYDGFDLDSNVITDFDLPAYYSKDISSQKTVPDWKPDTAYIRGQLIKYKNFYYIAIDDIAPSAVFNFNNWRLIDYTEIAPSRFISPILTPYTLSRAEGTGKPNTDSDISSTNELWSTDPYLYWFDNYKLSLQSTVIVNGGTGFVEPPELTVVGESVSPALLTAQINSLGQISNVIVDDPGSGYLSTPIITISGTGTGANITAIMGNPLVRQIKTTMKFDRYQYQSDITDWTEGVTYLVGQRVRYGNRVWVAIENSSSMVFNVGQWSIQTAASLSGIDRTRGYYVPTADQFGVDLDLLAQGISYPGVQVYGLLFSDNITSLDANYESSFLDAYLGTRSSDINVVGGAFVDEYSGHAPEELVAGSIFDTLDFRVYTRPGADWQGDGHGFPLNYVKFQYNSMSLTEGSFKGIMPNPVQILVSNQTQRRNLIPGQHYLIDWVNQTVSIVDNITNPAANNGDIIVISVYGIGGGNQIYRDSYTGNQVGNQLILPISYAEVDQLVIFVNGQLIDSYSYTETDNGLTQIDFSMTYISSDYVNITVLSASSFAEDVSWSTAITEYFTADGSTLDFVLSSNMSGINAAVAIVEINGIRARPPAGARYIADGSSAFALPTRLGFSQSTIADSDVVVWLNNELQVSGVDYLVEPYVSDSDLREVIFAITPDDGDQIDIAVFTDAGYSFTGLGTNTVTLNWNSGSGFVPIADDIVSITTWNDTQQQKLSTTVYVGPVDTTVVVSQPYDTTPYDPATTSFSPGSFDYADGLIIAVNNFLLDKIYTKPERLWVTLNGSRLFYGSGFTVQGQELILTAGVIAVNDVLAITEITDSVTPDALAFRIFQDMRGLQSTYRMTDQSTTELAVELDINDDVIYLADATGLGIPDPDKNILGAITVNGERITYRLIDKSNNTISGIRRGTAGTAIAVHAAGSTVYDIGLDNLLSSQYQNYAVRSTALADGITNRFTAENINLDYYIDSSGFIESALRVYVGGQLQVDNYFVSNYKPITVEFDVAPPIGQEVVIETIQALSWYQPGPSTPSNGQALQETDTLAARFFKGF